MKKQAIHVDGEDDDEFLSMVDAAAAEALASSKAKRQKLSSPESIPEGPYMAALRGSRSALWQQQQQQQQHGSRHQNNNIATFNQASKPLSTTTPSSNADSCFKCGMSGHWARDCTNNREGRQGEGGGGDGGRGADGEVPEKACPCGSGICLVLTSNTAKNPGRKFYRCPLRSENGGCNFFEWCDSPSSGSSAMILRSAPTYESILNSRVPVLLCPCGAGICLVLTTKSGKNMGQRYYCCPGKKGIVPCGFFKWCNERNPAANEPAFTSPNNPSSQFSGASGSPCFKCGGEGHWARDCGAKPASDYNAASSGSGSGSGTCFKCGKAGHWARDCPAQDSGVGAGSRKASDSFASSFKNRSR